MERTKLKRIVLSTRSSSFYLHFIYILLHLYVFHVDIKTFSNVCKV